MTAMTADLMLHVDRSARVSRSGRPPRNRAAQRPAFERCHGRSTSQVVVLVVSRGSDLVPQPYRRTRLLSRISERIELAALKPAEATRTSLSHQALPVALPDPELFAGQLSRREVEVVRLVMTGMTNREIANKLFIAERTAEGHVERIRNKLGVRSRTEVAIWATRHGLGQGQ